MYVHPPLEELVEEARKEDMGFKDSTIFLQANKPKSKTIS